MNQPAMVQGTLTSLCHVHHPEGEFRKQHPAKITQVEKDPDAVRLAFLIRQREAREARANRPNTW